MPRPEQPEEKSDHPSEVALRNERELGSLRADYKNLSDDVVGLRSEVRDGLRNVYSTLDRLSDKMNRPPDKGVWVTMIGILVTFILGIGGLFLAGIPLIGALIYFTVTSTNAPTIERLGKLEQGVAVSKDHEWDNFELLIRTDQCLIDRGLKANETDTAIKVPQKKLKNKNQKAESK